jgi:Family of unknown function (DUF5954)
MTQDPDDMPEHLLIKANGPDDPISAVTEYDARRGMRTYPKVTAVGPVFFCTREDEGRWRILASGAPTPQGARDDLSRLLRMDAAKAAQDGDPEAEAQCRAAAELLDGEALDELTVLGRRLRIIRAEQFIRTGPNGPEPPRPTDPDPALPGAAHRVGGRARDFVIDTGAARGLAERVRRSELLPSIQLADVLPQQMRVDALHALCTSAGGVLLPAEFAVAEYAYGRWSMKTWSSSTPQGARDCLTTYLRQVAPCVLVLDEGVRLRYAQAADDLDAHRCDEIDVAGRQFRVVRVEHLIQVGRDGPEMPRPSDFDPDPPADVQTRRLLDEEGRRRRAD